MHGNSVAILAWRVRRPMDMDRVGEFHFCVAAVVGGKAAHPTVCVCAATPGSKIAGAKVFCFFFSKKKAFP
jgi:hypothetical protein